jgi:hypothetical protein
MATVQTQTSAPAGPSAMQTLVHYVRGGLIGGVFGLAFAALMFGLLLVGFLYAGQTIHGKEQPQIVVPLQTVVPQLPQVVLTPPITAVDLEPPEGKQEGFDAAYLEACWRLVWQAVEIETTWRTLLIWAAVAGAFGLVVGLIGALFKLIFSTYWSPVFGILAFLAAAAGIGLFVAHDYFQMTLPIDFELDAQARLLVYAAVAALNLLWISIAGFRFRALLFIVLTVLAGELLPHGLPPDQWTTAMLWHVSVFLFVPTGYAWLAVERAEAKNI